MISILFFEFYSYCCFCAHLFFLFYKILLGKHARVLCQIMFGFLSIAVTDSGIMDASCISVDKLSWRLYP